jgi:hypothetical protein
MAYPSGDAVSPRGVGAARVSGAHRTGRARFRRGGVSVWRASHPGGCSEAAPHVSISPRAKRSSCSRFLTTPTAASRGARRRTSFVTSASRDRRCRLRSTVCRNSGRSSSMSLGGRGARLGIDSASSVPVNLPDHRACWSRETCPIYGAASDGTTCPIVGHEGIYTHVRRSAVPWRALPGATRSLRSLVCSRMDSMTSSRIGRLAGRCPSGEEARGAVTVGAWQDRVGYRPAWSRSCRLPAALADDGETHGRHVHHLARGTGDQRGVWGCPALPQYARGWLS